MTAIHIKRYVYHQSTKTNEIVDGFVTNDIAETPEKTIERHYPAHKPVEKYTGWGKGNVFIGGLSHTFSIEPA